MGSNRDKLDILGLARRRRQLIEIERDFFKSRTSTTIEILTYLAENNFTAQLSAIYEVTKATDVSVRQHLRALERLNIIEKIDGESDRRAKIISMTDHGRTHLIKYAHVLDQLIKE